MIEKTASLFILWNINSDEEDQDFEVLSVMNSTERII
jgi:hypothetical protein